MYRRPKFLEALLEIRRKMAREADYDVELFAETARSGVRASTSKVRSAGRVNDETTIPNANTPKFVKAVDG